MTSNRIKATPTESDSHQKPIQKAPKMTMVVGRDHQEVQGRIRADAAVGRKA
jgi:hypothetical protein